MLPNGPAHSGCRDSCSPHAPPDSAVKPTWTSDAQPSPQSRTQMPDTVRISRSEVTRPMSKTSRTIAVVVSFGNP